MSDGRTRPRRSFPCGRQGANANLFASGMKARRGKTANRLQRSRQPSPQGDACNDDGRADIEKASSRKDNCASAEFYAWVAFPVSTSNTFGVS